MNVDNNDNNDEQPPLIPTPTPTPGTTKEGGLCFSTIPFKFTPLTTPSLYRYYE